MIVGIEGEVIHKTPLALWVKSHGLVYEVFVPLSILLKIQEKDIFLYVSHIVRQDDVALYGFLESSEKEFFDRLIKINGVGPKVALAILSTYTPCEFLSKVQAHDLKSIQKVPGLGAKSAGRIVVELDGFLLHNTQEVSFKKDAQFALESLGFKADKIHAVLAEIEADSIEETIKQALKKL